MATLSSILKKPSDFLEKDIFTIMGLESIDQKRKDDLLDVMEGTITTRVVARILDDLGDEKAKHLEDLISSESSDHEVLDFLEENKIDYIQYYAEEAVIYKSEVLSMITDPDSVQQFIDQNKE
jgi:hypothetical protein